MSSIESEIKSSLPAVCSAILVGREAKSLNVVLAVRSLRRDALVFANCVHRIPQGRTAVGEAMIAFGLDRIRLFPAESPLEALQYAAHLEAEAGDDAPVIL